MRHDRIGGLPRSDLLAADDQRDFDLTTAEVLERRLQLAALARAGRVGENRLVAGGRNLGCVHAGKSNRGTRACSGGDMTIDPRTRIGHVHLTVSDLDRALSFYRDVLGFDITARYAADAVFLSAGGYHHHIGLNTWAGRGAPP